ncbi:ABC-2 family transporter protein [Chloroflexus aggregans]|uniref:ABC-2 family transporter protein n=1 Tax=Chloroflexus aggregans TaxID=152260 RepID=UPI0000E7A978|nr:ABC-2 family transporter protein [Chloroflexus aggregans]
MMFLWLLGLISFWTTRVAALYELFFALELFLSGRIAPLVLFPEWTQRLADWLPFRRTFGFPIEAFIGQLTTAKLVGGLAMQNRLDCDRLGIGIGSLAGCSPSLYSGRWVVGIMVRERMERYG